ncbi:unnamed protein product, partial [Polarella glacialis]
NCDPDAEWIQKLNSSGDTYEACCDLRCGGFLCPHGYRSLSSASYTVSSTRDVCCEQNCSGWSGNSPDISGSGLYLNGFSSLSSGLLTDEYTFVRIAWYGTDSNTGIEDTQYIQFRSIFDLFVNRSASFTDSGQTDNQLFKLSDFATSDTGLSSWVQSAGGAWLCLSHTNGPTA